jgi:hypothetical protein
MKKPINEIKKMQRLAGLITESEYRESLENEAADYSKVDSILGGTYKRPEPVVNPEIQKISQVLDKFVSKPFDYEKLEDLLNALGPVKPQKLDKAIDMMKMSSFELSGDNNFWNLIVQTDNYSDDSEGVALSWDGRKWEAG